jgi:hypothetical protein
MIIMMMMKKITFFFESHFGEKFDVMIRLMNNGTQEFRDDRIVVSFSLFCVVFRT